MAKSPKNGSAAANGCLDQLFQIIVSRRGADPQQSYTARLFAKGRLKMAKKVGEEATEVVIAALAEDKSRLAAESADLLYHLMVLWAANGVQPGDVWAELERREGMSGYALKAAQNNNA
ncbi:MAG: phosphoribosyl-ATP diphosphatase [Defluviicoccus sp.]